MIKRTLLLLVILVPTFALMLRFGIYTMQDFHVFRQFEFDKCIQALTFPCRWAPDSGLGYGEPVFNFYGQFPYWVGELFVLLGFSIINSVKLLFIFTLLGSGVSMYWVSRKYWGEWGGFVSAVLYVYAPYRSVDVWVRGALPEAFAFVLFPIIFYNLDAFLKRHSKKNLWLLVLGLSLLVMSHNLSFVMFVPFLALWSAGYWIVTRDFKAIPGLVLGAGLTMLLSAYYLLPVAIESKLVTVSQTTQGYYDYRAHFATLRQLFFSRVWGYGASLWGPVDELSFSVGQVQWIVLVGLGVLGLVVPVETRKKLLFGSFLALGAGAIFLTHNKSQLIWQNLAFMPYVQFPWRFLSQTAFFMSLAAGFLGAFPNKIKWTLGVVVIIACVVTNVEFFRPDIWRAIGDKTQFSGPLWDEERSSALQDFWPKTAKTMPNKFAPDQPDVFEVEATGQPLQVATVYFPGWRVWIDGQEVPAGPSGDLGLITFDVPAGRHQIELNFTDTWPRTTGNLLTLVGVGIMALWLLKIRGSSSA